MTATCIVEPLCIRCGQNPRRPGGIKGQRWCQPCQNEYSRAYRPKHSELSPEARRRSNCRAYLNVYVGRGLITRGPCEVCGHPDTQAHHDDYSKPLEVRWLCHWHHQQLTNAERGSTTALSMTPVPA